MDTQTSGTTSLKPGKTPPIRRTSEPFDREDADLIVRSSDNVDFYVHRLILSLASPVFASMLTFPQPPGTDPVRPVVDVLEKSEALDVFFRVLYPVPDPELQSLSSIREVLVAAMKYDSTAVVASMKRALSQSRAMEDNPLRVFAIACYFGMEAEAKIAAEKAVLNNRVTGRICAELNEISAGAYYRLLQLNRTRKTIQSKASGINRVTVDFAGIGPFCEAPMPAATRRREPLASAGHPFDAPEADLTLRSCDAVEFRVSRAIILLSSTAFLQRVLREPVEESEHPAGEPPVYPMKEDSVVVDALLRICYPVAHPALSDLDLLLDVLAAGHKYDIKKVEQVARDALSANIGADPLRLYLAAARCGWTAEARMCADELRRRYDVSTISGLYHADMETASNRWYRYLLFYVDECCKAAAGRHELYLTHTQCCGQPAQVMSLSDLDSDSEYCGYLCLEMDACCQRYPEVVQTDPGHVPSWLSSSFASIIAALKEKPCATSLASNTEAAKALINLVASDTLPCTTKCHSVESTQRVGRQTIRTVVVSRMRTCTAADHVLWACTLLRRYAKKVDKAIQKVPFVLPDAESPSPTGAAA